MSYDAARNTFVWSVPMLTDGKLEEEFSRNLFIARIRAFTGSPGYYLPILGIRAEDIQRGCTHDADDDTQVTVGKDNCPLLRGLVPSATHWKIDVPAPGVGTLQPNSYGDVWIEFTLADRGSVPTGPLLAPAQFDLGNASTGILGWPAALGIQVDNAGPWTVDSLTAVSTTPGLSATIHGPRRIPFALAAFDAFSVDLAVDGATPGDKSGQIKLHLSGPNGQTSSLSVPIAAYIWPTSAQLLPAQRNFGAAYGTAALPWRGNMILTNDAPWSIRVSNIAVMGGGASAFRLVESDGQTPLAFPQPILSGEALYFAVQYCPTSASTFDATLQAQADVSSDPTQPDNVTLPPVSLHGDPPPSGVSFCSP